MTPNEFRYYYWSAFALGALFGVTGTVSTFYFWSAFR